MNDTLAAALIGGAFALLGVFFGAKLTRRSEYEKWLRQQRSMEFANFLGRLYEIRLEVTNAIYSTKGTEQSRNIAATEIFLELRKYENVARLYIRKSKRELFSKLIHDLWNNCTASGGPANRSEKIKDIEQSIQYLIENELECI